MLPEAIRSFSKFLPLTNVVTLLERLLFGSPLGDHLMEVAVLGGVMMAGVGGSQESGGNCRLTRRLMSGIRPEAGV